MKDRFPAPLYAPADDTGSAKKGERTKVNMDAVEGNIVAAELIAHSLLYGIRTDDIGTLLTQHVPKELIPEPIKGSTIHGRTKRAQIEAGKTGQSSGDRQQDYINHLQRLHAGNPLSEGIAASARSIVLAYLRNTAPSGYWLKDDECRALIRALTPGMQKTGDEHVYPADIARVLTEHLGKRIDNSVVESYCAHKDMTPGKLFKLVSEQPLRLSPRLIADGEALAPILLARTRAQVQETRGRPGELDSNLEARAFAAALLEQGRPIKSIELMAGRRGLKIPSTTLHSLVQRHKAAEDPFHAASAELARNVPDRMAAARAEAEAAWLDHLNRTFENKYLKAEIFQRPETCALLAVLLDETNLSAPSITQLVDERYQLTTGATTLGRFVDNNGGRTDAATVLVMHKAEITPEMLEDTRNEVPALLARLDEERARNVAAGQQKRLVTLGISPQPQPEQSPVAPPPQVSPAPPPQVTAETPPTPARPQKKTAEAEGPEEEEKRRKAVEAARKRIETEGEKWLAHPKVQQLLGDIQNPKFSRNEYAASAVSILRRIGDDGKPVMARGVTVTLAKDSELPNPETRSARDVVADFLLAYMTDAEAGGTNALSKLLDANKYGYIQLRRHGEKRMQYGKLTNPIVVVKTIFRPE